MLGAIVGDIVGSRYEFFNHKSKRFPLFGGGCRLTDDSVMTLAVAAALMEAGDDADALPAAAVRWMQEFGHRYPDYGFGGSFRRWLDEPDPQPYGSWGNGAAMRVSPVGLWAQSASEVKALSFAVTAVSHDHPEALKGAEATAMAVYLARRGESLDAIRARMERDYYRVDFTLDDIRPTYRFDVSCQGTLPAALEALYESTSFEDALRNAVSVGGDSDTIAAITGSIAAPLYGIPAEISRQALDLFDDFQRDILTRWEAALDVRNAQ